MARNKRKHNLKIQMLAGNRLKSFPDARSQKTMTLICRIRVYVNLLITSKFTQQETLSMYYLLPKYLILKSPLPPHHFEMEN